MPESATLYQACQKCKGRGLVRIKEDHPNDYGLEKVCPQCGGMGLTRSRILMRDATDDLPNKSSQPLSPNVVKMTKFARRRKR